jgi:hypothetical protein
MKVLSSMQSGASIFTAILRRPDLWLTAVRQLFRLIPRRWWATSPFLPIPARDYLRFRLITQYGDHQHVVEVADVLSYLTWVKDFR